MKQSGAFQVTMLLSMDGPKLLEREISMNGASSLVINFSNHRSLNGIYLPYCVSLSQTGKLDYIEMRAKDVSLNDEDYASKAINLTLPSGTIVTSVNKSSGTGFVPHGIDLLDDVVARSRDASLHWNEAKQDRFAEWQTLFGGKVGSWAWRILALGCGFILVPCWRFLRGASLP